MIRHILAAGLALAGLAASSVALAVLPPPTQAQAAAAAAKKAAADAQAQKDKAELLATMDALTSRWRARAPGQGWAVHPPVAVAAAPAAVTAPVSGAAAAGQPGGQQGPAVAVAPIRSEKLGTAPPSTDVKAAPTPALPKGAPPTVDKHKK
jgi:colicin import membrane protein